MYRLLIADDEIKIREVIAEYGRINNYSVMEASDGLQAIEMVEKHDFDCVILDIMMPNLDGYTACKRIKEIKNVPIIILSARQQEDDKLYGFELGIDDYVTKPFSPRELMARIKVVIERSNKARKTQEKEVIKYEGITVNIPSHEITIDGNDIHLTNKEFDLLVYFLNNQGIVISRDTLLERIWGYDYYGVERTVDTHIKMLRKNLGEYSYLIKTVRGEGYRFG
ncbi:MAG: response regulator transcription factor [Erysipelotrichaceae bacterium]|nr:response regulator transcription factor [Erysipelotrichaceae bacterium]MBQ1303730.1 response regulator transcription factor [Erysipelotrichaceae bacterium]MBQ2685055.1 response regulator transcription factor [Erysipelotrichaceae bacterium]